MPKVEIRSESCKACEYCIVTCPKKVLAIGAANNSKGYHYVVPANPDACIGCKLCAIVCQLRSINNKRRMRHGKEVHEGLRSDC